MDAPQREIARALRQAGASVAITSNVGDGFPDLVVGVAGRQNVLVEVKDGGKAPSDRRLTPAQVRFRDEWRGEPPYTVLSVDDALLLVHALRKVQP